MKLNEAIMHYIIKCMSDRKNGNKNETIKFEEKKYQ